MTVDSRLPPIAAAILRTTVLADGLPPLDIVVQRTYNWGCLTISLRTFKSTDTPTASYTAHICPCICPAATLNPKP